MIHLQQTWLSQPVYRESTQITGNKCQIENNTTWFKIPTLGQVNRLAKHDQGVELRTAVKQLQLLVKEGPPAMSVGLTTSHCSDVPDKREQRKSSLPAMLPSALTESVIRQFTPEELTLTQGSYTYITFCVSVKFPWKEETL